MSRILNTEGDVGKMNYRKTFKRRKKAELIRLIALYGEEMMKAGSAEFPQNFAHGCAAGAAAMQYTRVMSQSFKRKRGKTYVIASNISV